MDDLCGNGRQIQRLQDADIPGLVLDTLQKKLG